MTLDPAGIPRGWISSQLGAIGRYHNGRGFKKSEWSQNGRPIIRIQNLTGTSSSFNYYSGNDINERYLARRGDLLLSWAATLGAYFWTGPEAVVNQHIFKVESFIDQRFHKYLLDFKLLELMRKTHGSGMVHITRGDFDQIPVCLPESRQEQLRVVDILDDHLSRLDASRMCVGAAHERIKSLNLASLHDSMTTTGTPPIHKLSYGQRWLAVPSDWAPSSVGREAELVEYGSSSKTSDDSTGIPVVRMGNIVDGTLSWSSLKYLPLDHPDSTRYELHRGDLLFNRTNSSELVGKTAVFESDMRAAFASYLIRVRFGDRVLPEWAALVINSPLGRAYVASVVTQQVGQANVNGTKLKKFPLPVPPLEVQAIRIARHRVRTESAKQLRQELKLLEDRSLALRRALLASAFSGRLTGRASDMDRVEEMAGV